MTEPVYGVVMVGGKEKSRWEGWPVETFPRDTCAVKVSLERMNHQYEKLRTSLILSNQGPIIRFAFFVNQLPFSDLSYVTLTIENVKFVICIISMLMLMFGH